MSLSGNIKAKSHSGWDECRVVTVIDPWRVVINKGASNGVSLGDRFVVLHIGKEPLVDPVDGTELEPLQIVRGTGVVIHIQDKIATIRSDRTDRVAAMPPEPSVMDQLYRTLAISAAVAKSVGSVGGSAYESIRATDNALSFDSPEPGDIARRVL